ncbi:hypothetical protein N7462_006799 [Penicillium macrosclerotiorum]|uniref:uncharacterized protein n=1 Tax=Penicillium macrosclerotiorum TaxID=303699 RepID=UPI002547F40B|nr:uncharacterized protein N7462_006799 [Penicillium macrosclerotiorum]KAJ5683634.1 hypothetical protein N7462_006799 [Penicillium macrosclerotiorum]
MGMLCFVFYIFSHFANALKFDPNLIQYNLNTNKTANNVLDYSGSWPNHVYHPSPINWRIPFYTLFLDRFADGNPQNNDINNTVFEVDTFSNQLRFGGDVRGLEDSLDYIQGMGIKGIYIAGTPFLNFPWKSDGYSPLDLSLLDPHLGNIQQWRSLVEDIHQRGMYVMVDITFGTMADLLGFENFLNSTAPLNPKEYKTVWKGQQKYFDFVPGEKYKKECVYPKFYKEDGYPVSKGSDAFFDQLEGCYDSEFDQYGAMDSVSLAPDWQRSLAKAGLVQDRLREWFPSVREKLEHFYCMMIASLDIDAIRFDKAGQITVDSLGDSSQAIRKCASNLGKANILLAGEITAGNNYASIYFGRGREPHMRPQNEAAAIQLNDSSTSDYFIREHGKNAMDAAAFHYSIYRALTRFLGMDGNFTAPWDLSTDFVAAWNEMLISNDLINANTGEFDPRHMFGTSNQDTFRWPAIKQGVEKFLLGQFITTLHLPGIPVLLWGEEQALYVLDSTSPLALFGRQPMCSSTTWSIQGCYGLGSNQYNNFPVESASTGCDDPGVGMDHRDPTHPVRGILKSFFHLREKLPTLKDGYYLEQISKQTRNITLPGSNGTVTELGAWSVLRDQYSGVNYIVPSNETAIWLVYHNEESPVQYNFDCKSSMGSFLAPYPAGTRVKNLLAPYDEISLQPSGFQFNNSTELQGCLENMKFEAFDYKLYVPISRWIPPPTMLTNFLPGHDARINSNSTAVESHKVDIQLEFSAELDCDRITQSITISSSTESKISPQIDKSSISCSSLVPKAPRYVGQIPSAWLWKGTLDNVTHGIHALKINNASNSDRERFTDSVDRLVFRIGRKDNVMIFPLLANYTNGGFRQSTDGEGFVVDHKAAGADMWRYSTNWASTWSEWKPYEGSSNHVNSLPWSGTNAQKWQGDHIILQYWSQLAGSSQHIQHVDIEGFQKPPRRFPHLFAIGPFNSYGADNGIKNAFTQDTKSANWELHLTAEWPTNFQVNVWGFNPDKQLDKALILGDTLNSSRLNRLPPDSLSFAEKVVNFSQFPPPPYMAYRMELNDGTMKFQLHPAGLRVHQQIIYILLWAVPILTGVSSVLLYMKNYKITFNLSGDKLNFSRSFLPLFFRNRQYFQKVSSVEIQDHQFNIVPDVPTPGLSGMMPLITIERQTAKRTILLATLEYDIEDWAIKIKIGGLGVMAQLMGKNLAHHDIVWVVPCVGGVDYPVDTPAEPMSVTVVHSIYDIQVQYHKLRNITYVLLDAPVFRQQSKSEPYPPRMDDLQSAIYYSAWNSCIAEAARRFPIDIYHVNDYHGALAPLHLLPKTIPCCLSLHNAEFQGLWPLRSQKETEEISEVFNLDISLIRKYVQFGEVFNLLHAGASYLRIHQHGFGAVGVSAKYGDRSHARYPIFWGLKEIGKLPNPDPSDTDPCEDQSLTLSSPDVVVDHIYEQSRGDLRRQAQEWAGLHVDPKAELFVFVGRWSVQKGIDLIADIFPSILEKNPHVQLICVGPVIDMYGKFAALKLQQMMKIYRKQVFSKPEFTVLPPFIFSGAEFALIPSRDEPFGLVAVEFGRKGALGVGSLVGGLGQMPGWWYPVESMTARHLQKQFKSAVENALKSTPETRAIMRAHSAKQRFPVARWVEDLDHLHARSIKMHGSGGSLQVSKQEAPTFGFYLERPALGTRAASQTSLAMMKNHNLTSPDASRWWISPSIVISDESPTTQSGMKRTFSLGSRRGPGHHSRQSVLFEETELTPRLDEVAESDDYSISVQEAQTFVQQDEQRHQLSPSDTTSDQPRGRSHTRFVSQPTPLMGLGLGVDAISSSTTRVRSISASSALSVDRVKENRESFSLENADPIFMDETKKYARYFEGILQRLNGKTSEDELCIEDFIVNSEKEWTNNLRRVKMGRLSSQSPSPLLAPTRSPSIRAGSDEELDDVILRLNDEGDLPEFLLPKDFQRPSAVQRWMTARAFDWPVYSIILGLGQIMAANSYQITLLTSEPSQNPILLYVLGAIYILTSGCWWLAFRRFPSVYLLPVPFVFYGLAFIILGISAFIQQDTGKTWVQYIATSLYIIGSSSGYLFFSLNFGDDGGSKIDSWVYRACIIQGTQNIYITCLFFWGAEIASGERGSLGLSSTTAAVAMVAGIVLWLIATALFIGLPVYYRQTPGKIPAFYKSILRRKIVIWFTVSVILQNYFLGIPYGRNWAYLWGSKYVPRWAVLLLAFLFFIVIWYALLAVLAWRSKSHSWIMPIFAVGLGAPRWAQIFWGTSGIGWWVPWMIGGAKGSALGGRAVWLWLGTLDSIQGVGFGMMLLQTLTRIHIAATLCAAQLIGTVTTLIASATAPDRDGPGDVFPDFSAGILLGIKKPWFWIALICQLIIPIGYLKFFRNEQLNKP